MEIESPRAILVTVFVLYLCTAEEYHILHWKYIDTFDTLKELQDELASPTFFVQELMVAKVVKNDIILHTLFYANGEWISLDKGSDAAKKLAIPHLYTSVVEWWRTANGPLIFEHCLSVILNTKSLVRSCIIRYCTENDEAMRGRVREALLENRVLIWPNEMNDIMRDFTANDHSGALARLRNLIELDTDCDSFDAALYIVDYMRTQITAPIFLARLAKAMQS